MASFAALPHFAARSSVISTSAITNAPNPGVIRRADVLGPRLPRMNSLGDVQAALAEVWTALATHRVPLQRASARLFDLELAAISLREPRPVSS